MKISRSLKIYFICAVMAIATVTVVSFSTLAANYYVAGMDISLRYSMLGIVKHVDTSNNKPEYMLGYQLTTSWNDVQPEIKRVFHRPNEHLEFQKKLDNTGWFHPPTRAFFLLRYDRENGQTVYISRVFDRLDTDQMIKDSFHEESSSYDMNLILYAFLALVFFAAGLYFLFRHIARPQEKLVDWARNLTPEQLELERPDFYFNELNRLADIIKSSLSSVQVSLKRERSFLANASHELRTPIAVVRSNAELMNKLIDKPHNEDNHEKQKQVMQRILRAGITMTDLCETLLWLNRREQSELPLGKVSLANLVDQVSRELNYLLRDKSVEVEINIQEATFELPKTLCRIVIANLIRNAYQHTHSGKVFISQKGTKVSIVNHNDGTLDDESLGFGLGLELTNRIIRQYDWHYSTLDTDHGREVFIDFRPMTKNAHQLD
ncbi:sensor histidine kinase [Vibrio sp. CAIM 722]|uniref:histidine kinase n=1 Tax=Vibrio eleionomae TaxID=2653505 RepID=A0A7X4LNN6_9VIBR|nr:HAMP domain-containing sensor histidine kinase [Vibrio eleionomae]MZI95297.1 sensor histidine kinase [Vibrio eleionomae]